MSVISLRDTVLTAMPPRSTKKVAIVFVPERTEERFKHQPELNWRGIANHVFVLGLAHQSHCSRLSIAKMLTEQGRGHSPIAFFYPAGGEPGISPWSKWISAKLETTSIDTLILNIGSVNSIGLVETIRKVWGNTGHRRRELYFVDSHTVRR